MRVPCGAGGLEPLRKHFEWGEYDSLIAKCRSDSGAAADTSDSLTRSELRKYLGVAYFAKGNLGLAGEYFARSFELNPTVALDSDFVSRPLYDFFVATLDDVRKRRLELAHRDSLIVARDRQLRNSQGVRAADSLRRTMRAPLAAGIAAATAAVAAAALAADQYRRGEDAYADFLGASQRGDLAARRRDSVDVVSADRWTVVGGGAAILLCGTATFFFAKSGRRAREARRLTPSLAWSPQRGAYGVAARLDF
jgi:hypothetical protein